MPRSSESGAVGRISGGVQTVAQFLHSFSCDFGVSLALSVDLEDCPAAECGEDDE